MVVMSILAGTLNGDTSGGNTYPYIIFKSLITSLMGNKILAFTPSTEMKY